MVLVCEIASKTGRAHVDKCDDVAGVHAVGLPVNQLRMDEWPTWVRFILASAVAIAILDFTLMVAILFYQGLMFVFGR